MHTQVFRFLLLLIITSCNSKQEKTLDVSAIYIPFSIDRFDVDFYTTTKKSLPTIKEKYPLFFPEKTPDSVWVHKINNKEEQELFSETQKIYTDISFLKDDLKQLFKHLKYYRPSFKAPKVVTLLNNIDYENKIIYTKDFLLISLDAYLGSKHPFYANYPKYITQNLHKERIVIDVANAIITSEIKKSTDRSFIGKMVNEGLKLYLLDVYIPTATDANKIGYTDEKLNWTITNEEQIWKYFIENKLLFSTDRTLNKRFLDLAPFSKFYKSEDNLSPGRIGAWVGWQIVRSYMKHNDVSLQKLRKTSTEEIYKKSKYKPKR